MTADGHLPPLPRPAGAQYRRGVTDTAGTTRLAAVAVAALGLLAFGPPTVAAADTPAALPGAFAGPLPVPLSKSAAQQVGLADKDALPAGANYVDPTAARRHPNPVILVHGLDDNAASAWQSLAPLLRNTGFNVWAFTFGRYTPTDEAGGLADIRDSARELQAHVAAVLAATGARRVDLVGHSEGGVIIAWYVNELGGDRFVGNVVDLGVPNAGLADTDGLNLSVTDVVGHPAPAVDQLDEQSPFFAALRAAGPTRPDVRYTCIGTRDDEVVVPHSSLYLPAAPNVTNIELQDLHPSDAGEHFALPYDPYALADVVHALDPTIDWHIPPGVVLPYQGGYRPLP